ncbi:MAG: hypothetical protein HOO86_14430 [Bacteroidales bacterium]|jgi:hypothetical protein|nr:hypothetical protein [Bacteroidales bacterium]
MKKITLFLLSLVVVSTIVLSCAKSDSKPVKTTGHLYVKLNYPDNFIRNGSNYSVDYDKDSSVEVYTSGDNVGIIEVYGKNKTVFDCGELNPGNYIVDDHLATGNIYAHNFSSETIQIIANQDKTLTFGEDF